MNDMQTFKNQEFGKVRTITIDGEPWFVGKDVARALGYRKTENALAAHVDDEDKAFTLIQGGCSTGQQRTTIINESGLYALIFGSKLESAKRFKRWVTSEVLPSIRKTGSYSAQDAPDRQRVKNPWGSLTQTVVQSHMDELNRDIEQISELYGTEKNLLLHYLYEHMTEAYGIPLNSYRAVYQEEVGQQLSMMKVVCMSQTLFDIAMESTKEVLERKRIFG